MSGRGVWLEDLTWPEAQERFAAGAPVVLPVGAAAKAHGSHLPLKTDALTARHLGQALLERLPVVVAPVVGFGYYPASSAFAGSQHLAEPTFRQLLQELLEGLQRQGARRLALLNVGVSTEPAVDAAARAAGGDVLALHMRATGAAADRLLDQPDGGHADERETSVMLAIDARSVRLDRLAVAGPFETSAATGDPTRASAYKGERILAARLDDMTAAILGRWPDLRRDEAQNGVCR